MGVVPTEATIYEVLEELAITVQMQLSSRVPFCAFNGGWVGRPLQTTETAIAIQGGDGSLGCHPGGGPGLRLCNGEGTARPNYSFSRAAR